MRAFHGNKDVKKFYVDRVKKHAELDEIAKGVYYEEKDGKIRACGVGCTVHSSSHKSYEDELGIPLMLAQLEDRIFEDLPNDLAKTWPLRFLEAIKVGADLSLVWDRFASRLLTDPVGGVIQYAQTEDQMEAIQRVSDLYEAKIIGIEVTVEVWTESRRAADTAAYAANAAAAAAAYAAAAYAATAAYAAAAAHLAADTAAHIKNAYVWQSELLLELLGEAK